jgi:hypothetical protein
VVEPVADVGHDAVDVDDREHPLGHGVIMPRVGRESPAGGA